MGVGSGWTVPDNGAIQTGKNILAGRSGTNDAIAGVATNPTTAPGTSYYIVQGPLLGIGATRSYTTTLQTEYPNGVTVNPINLGNGSNTNPFNLPGVTPEYVPQTQGIGYQGVLNNFSNSNSGKPDPEAMQGSFLVTRPMRCRSNPFNPGGMLELPSAVPSAPVDLGTYGNDAGTAVLYGFAAPQLLLDPLPLSSQPVPDAPYAPTNPDNLPLTSSIEGSPNIIPVSNIQWTDGGGNNAIDAGFNASAIPWATTSTGDYNYVGVNSNDMGGYGAGANPFSVGGARIGPAARQAPIWARPRWRHTRPLRPIRAPSQMRRPSLPQAL